MALKRTLISTLLLIINKNHFELHPSGSMYWKEKETLLIADVHLGKVSHFRKYGSAVPQSLIQKNFEQLNSVITYFQPKQICFLGDLFHSAINKEWSLFENWRTKHATLDILLIVGNHDIISPLKYEQLNVNLASEWIYKDFLFTHHPEEREGFFNFSGHIHPGVEIKGIGKQRLKLACFHKKEHQIIFPAFGVFTGKHLITPLPEDKIYAVTKDQIIEINNQLL